MTGRLDFGSPILLYTCNEISRRCQKKEATPAKILGQDLIDRSRLILSSIGG
jgi:hypothetical protein